VISPHTRALPGKVGTGQIGSSPMQRVQQSSLAGLTGCGIWQRHVRQITSGSTSGLQWLHANRYAAGVAFFPSPTPACTVTLLGTSAGAPSSTRSASGTLVQWSNGSSFLVDAGDGTYERLMATAGAAVGKLDAIFITHLHGDHVLGLNALVTSALNPFASQKQDRQPWLVVGPVGTHRLIREAFQHYPRSVRNKVKLTVREILGPGQAPSVSLSEFGARSPVQADASGCAEVFSSATHTVMAAPTEHTVPTWSYIISERQRPTGRISTTRCAAMGVRRGPLMKKLQDGHTVTLPDGTAVHPDQVSDPPPRPRKVVVMGDTRASPAVHPHAMHADLCVHECTFLDAMGDARSNEVARRIGHSSADAVIGFARAVQPRALVLSHFRASAALHGAPSADMHSLGLPEAVTVHLLRSQPPRTALRRIRSMLRRLSGPVLSALKTAAPKHSQTARVTQAVLDLCAGEAALQAWLLHCDESLRCSMLATQALQGTAPQAAAVEVEIPTLPAGGSMPWDTPSSSAAPPVSAPGGGQRGTEQRPPAPASAAAAAGPGSAAYELDALLSSVGTPSSGRLPNLDSAVQRVFEGPMQWSGSNGYWTSQFPAFPNVLDASMVGQLAAELALKAGVPRTIAGRDYMQILLPADEEVPASR